MAAAGIWPTSCDVQPPLVDNEDNVHQTARGLAYIDQRELRSRSREYTEAIRAGRTAQPEGNRAKDSACKEFYPFTGGAKPAE